MPTIEQINAKKYLRAPTVEQINSFVQECKVSAYQFESFFGLPRGTIKVVRAGGMDMPKKFWHIFYEKVIPTYGTEPYKKPEAYPYPTKPVQKPVQKIEHPALSPEHHSRLSLLR